MRKTIFVFFILLGAAVGVIAAGNEGIGLQVIFGGFCALVGAVIGGVVTGIGQRRPGHAARFDDQDGFEEAVTKQVKNYWLDQGRLNESPGLPQAEDLDPIRHQP